MPAFVRKQLITINAKFVPPGWCAFINGVAQPIPMQPTAAEVVLTFCNPAGSEVTTTLPMTLGVDGVTWSAVWDSSAAGKGTVTWVVFASGAVQAADQGSFQILANRTNVF